MPAISQQQQKIMGLALSVKRGETSRSEVSDDVLKIVDNMSETDLEKYAGTEHTGLPKTVEVKIREMVRELYKEMNSVNEDVSKSAVVIASLTATRPDAVQKFVDSNELNIEKLHQFVKKGKLSDRMDFVSAMAGKPNNPIQKKMIKMFKESENEDTGTSSPYGSGYQKVEERLKINLIEKQLKGLEGIPSNVSLEKISKANKLRIIKEPGNIIDFFVPDWAKSRYKFWQVISTGKIKKNMSGEFGLEGKGPNKSSPTFKTMDDLIDGVDWKSVEKTRRFNEEKSFFSKLANFKIKESVNEGRYDADLDKIEAAVKNASSFMNVGSELKKIGVKYDFSTSMIPMYRIKVSGNTIAIVNKKYAAGAEREVKDIAIGLMENVIKESLSPEVAKHMASIHKGFKMVEDDGAMVYDSPSNAKKASDFLNSKKIAASFNGKYVYLESVNEAFKHIIHVDTPTQVVSKPVAAQIMALAKKGIRSKEIGLEMGFTGNAKLAADTFQKVKSRIYFELDKRESVVTEGASKEAMGIAALTATRGDAVQAFIDKHNLDGVKLFKSIKSSNLQGKMNFVSALVGHDGNPNQRLTIKLHKKNESVNETFREGTASHFNAELTKWAKKYNVKFDYKFKEKGKKSIPYFIIHTDVDDMDNTQTIELNKLTRLFHVDYRPIGKTLVVESILNEEEIRWSAVENAIINFLKMNTKILDKRVKDKDTDGVKGGLQSIIDGLTNAQRSLKLKK